MGTWAILIYIRTSLTKYDSELISVKLRVAIFVKISTNAYKKKTITVNVLPLHFTGG